MDRHDLPTAVAIGFTIKVLSTFGHEAIGHGAACVLTGCDPVQFSSTYFIGNKVGLSDSAIADPLLGSGPDRRSRLFALVLLPAIGAGAVLSGSALLSPVPGAAIFSFIGHVFPAIGAWGLLQWFVGDGKGEPARNIARSRAWWMFAAAVVVLAVGVVGPGVPRATRAEIEARAGG